MSENLALWNSVQTTDPSYTKPFNRGGGFKGTATNATYLAKKATEQFGPCGIGWGVNVLDERVLDGAPIGEGVVEKVHRVHIRFWYKLGDQKGEIEHFGQTTFAGKNKNGYFTDEEAPKKSLTDAMTKALSLLGFAADVHLGLYDDNRYVNDLRRRGEEERAVPHEVARSPEAPIEMTAAAEARIEGDLIARINEAQTQIALAKVINHPDNIRAFSSLDEAAQVRVSDAIAARRNAMQRAA